MTVTTTLDRQYFSGDGSNKNFPFNFRFFDNSQIYVYVIGADGTAIGKTLNVDYTLSGALAQGGGQVVFSVAPDAGTQNVLVQRIIPQTQPTSIRNQGAFFPAIHEDVFDRLTMLIQQALTGVSRSIQLNKSGVAWDFQGFRAQHLGDPVDPQDAATKNSVAAYVNSILATGQGPINNAVNVLFVGQPGTITNVQQLAGVNGAGLLGWKGFPLSDALPIYPEYFGAKGDGTTDDTVAFQAALDGLSNYGILQGKPGSTYLLKSGVTINKIGTTLRNCKIQYPKTAFPYLHCIRVAADKCQILGNQINTPTGLVRDDTGFAISVNAVYDTLIDGNVISNTASAAIWSTGSQGLVVTNNSIVNVLADGIHFSDGVYKFVCAGNTLTGCHDDTIAVVGDVPGDGVIPSFGLISGNVIQGSFAGHGIALVACESINVIGNVIQGTGSAAIGSYFWNVTGSPADVDWANNCLIEGNVITSPAVHAASAINTTGIFSGSFRNSTIRGNLIHASADSAYAVGSCVLIAGCVNLRIEENSMVDSTGHGVWALDSSATDATGMTNLIIRNNTFWNIAINPIRFITAAATIGNIAIENNSFYNCSYSATATYSMLVARTGANRLVIAGNRNIDNAKVFLYDIASCTNVYASDNFPAIQVAFTPAAVATTNAWTTATSTGSYYMRGGTVYGKVTITVTTKGTGTGAKFNLPKTMRGGNMPASIDGRENVGGNLLLGYALSTTQVAITDYKNADPATASGAVLDINFWYEAA